MRRRRFWSLAGVAGLVAAVALLVVPALGQVGDETGELHLQMDSVNGDRFVVFDSDGVQQGEQLLTTTTPNGCRLTDTANAALVHLVGSGLPTNRNPFAGIADHRLGVGQTGEGNGEPCARINKDRSQALTLSLTGELEGQAIDYAEINIGFKFDGNVILETSLGGNAVDSITVACNDASDCGPDSGGSDNRLVILSFNSADPDVASITGVFDTIVIKPGDASPLGAVSLEGDTLFNLVESFDGEIDCGENEILIEGEDATFSITRGLDTNGGCKGPPDGLLFTFAAGTEGDELFVDFFTEEVDADEGTVAQFLEVITWEFDSPPAAPPQHRILSYDDPPLDTEVDAPKQPMPWCLEDPRDADGNLPGGTVDPSVYLPGVHTSCLIESTSRVTPSGAFIKVDIVYNIGDGKRYT